MIGVYWITGPPTTAGEFDMLQNHVDLLSGKVHAVTTRATAAAADAAEIIRDTCLSSEDGFLDVLVVDHVHERAQLTPFFIDHPRPRRTEAVWASRLPPMRAGCASWRALRELLAAAQQECQAKLDYGRVDPVFKVGVDTVFKVGDLVLLPTKELLHAADIGKLLPRWD